MERELFWEAEGEDAGKTVESVLKRRFLLSSRQIGSAKFREGGILRNGIRTRTNAIVSEGDKLMIHLPDDGREDILVPVFEPLDIRFENEDILVVNKPAGIPTHPSHGHYADTLANQITGYYAAKEHNFRFRPVGRLDRETSGLICVAKNAAAAEWMAREREAGGFCRYYLALCQGILREKEGCVTEPIREVPGIRMLREVHEEGAYARTDYRVLEEYGNEPQGPGYPGFSLVKLKLHTGRTHQIRVHMSWLGHPLLGDALYCGDRTQTEGSLRISRTALHSWKLKGTLPFTGDRFELCCELPEDMKRLTGDFKD